MIFKAALCLLAATFWFAHASANIFRVNSNLTTDAAQKLYKSIQEANDDINVAEGDTLMVEGSPIVYEDVTLTKPMVLIGPGYLLAQNPQTQADGAQAVVSRITIQQEAAGTILMGLTFSPNSSFNAPWISADNVIVMRCYLPYNLTLTGSFNNVQILENFFETSGVAYNSSFDSFTGIVLKNNIVEGQINISSPTDYQRSFDVVENNIFLSNVTLTTNIFRSNIIVSKTATVNISSGTIQKNLVAGTQLSGDNIQSYNEAQLFVGPTGNSPDGQYKIKEGSPYKAAGYGGTEPGIFGGSRPYVLSGLPPVPSIYELTAENFASKQDGLKVNIKVKANQ